MSYWHIFIQVGSSSQAPQQSLPPPADANLFMPFRLDDFTVLRALKEQMRVSPLFRVQSDMLHNLEASLYYLMAPYMCDLCAISCTWSEPDKFPRDAECADTLAQEDDRSSIEWIFERVQKFAIENGIRIGHFSRNDGFMAIIFAKHSERELIKNRCIAYVSELVRLANRFFRKGRTRAPHYHGHVGIGVCFGETYFEEPDSSLTKTQRDMRQMTNQAADDALNAAGHLGKGKGLDKTVNTHHSQPTSAVRAASLVDPQIPQSVMFALGANSNAPPLLRTLARKGRQPVPFLECADLMQTPTGTGYPRQHVGSYLDNFGVLAISYDLGSSSTHGVIKAGLSRLIKRRLGQRLSSLMEMGSIASPFAGDAQVLVRPIELVEYPIRLALVAKTMTVLLEAVADLDAMMASEVVYLRVGVAYSRDSTSLNPVFEEDRTDNSGVMRLQSKAVERSHVLESSKTVQARATAAIRRMQVDTGAASDERLQSYIVWEGDREDVKIPHVTKLMSDYRVPGVGATWSQKSIKLPGNGRGRVFFVSQRDLTAGGSMHSS